MKNIALLFPVLWITAACSFGGGRMSLAPHLSRETELGPAAAAGRYGVVMDRASAFESQNQASRDVHWYRAWRASAMLGLGQVDEAAALLDKVLTDIANTSPAPAQADRLRIFVYDLRARAALVQNRPGEALADLERSFSLASEVQLETNGDCDRSLMLASRSRQLSDVAAAAGNAGRADSAKGAMERHLDKFSKCLAEQDYPGMTVVETLMLALSKSQPAAVAAVQPAVVAEPVVAPPVVAKKPAEPVKTAPVVAQPKPAAPADPAANMPSVRAQYAPIDPTPWRAALESAAALAAKHAPNLKADVVIRTDGQHHALRLKAVLPKYQNPTELVPLFRSTVVFFEQARSIEPKVDRVVVVVEAASGVTQILATRADVLELFQDRLDAAGFVKKLVRVL
jgi:hypothetical protein